MQIHLSSPPSPSLLIPLWPHGLPPSLRSFHALHLPFPLLGVQSLPHPLQISVPVSPSPLGEACPYSPFETAKCTPNSSLFSICFSSTYLLLIHYIVYILVLCIVLCSPLECKLHKSMDLGLFCTCYISGTKALPGSLAHK